MALAPSRGKERGETALLRKLLDDQKSGTVLLADRYSCHVLVGDHGASAGCSVRPGWVRQIAGPPLSEVVMNQDGE